MKNKSVKIVAFIVAFAVILFGIVTNLQLIYSGVLKLWNIFSTVITALLLAFMLNVLMEPIENKWLGFMRKYKWKHLHAIRRAVALVLTYLITLSVIAVIILFLVPQIKDTALSLVDKFPGFVESIVDWAENKMGEFNFAVDALPDLEIDWPAVATKFSTMLTDSSNRIINTATGAASSIINGVINVFFSIVMSAYILAQKEKIGHFISRFLNAFIPQKAVAKIERVSWLSFYVFNNFFSHQLLECLILGIMSYIGMLIFRFPYALIISVVIGITQLIPMVGPLIGEIIGAFILLSVSPLTSVLFIVFILILQQVENTVVYPRVVGKSVGLPGLLTFVTVVIGGKIGGLIGAFLGVPIVAVLYLLLQEAIGNREKVPEQKTEPNKKTDESETAFEGTASLPEAKTEMNEN